MGEGHRMETGSPAEGDWPLAERAQRHRSLIALSHRYAVETEMLAVEYGDLNVAAYAQDMANSALDCLRQIERLGGE